MFTPSRRFRRDYAWLFRRDPLAANALLLLVEIADERSRVHFDGPTETELAQLMAVRFADPRLTR